MIQHYTTLVSTLFSTYSCYQTNFREEQGRPVCTTTPLFLNQTILSYQIQQGQFVSGLFSPGFFAANETYPNNLLCLYNVRCSSGHLVYFNIVRKKLQDPVNGSCVDFIQIERPSLNQQLVTCGSDLERFQGIEEGALNVVFWTDSNVTDCGFFISAVCFDPSTLNAKKKKICENFPIYNTGKQYAVSIIDWYQLSGSRMQMFRTNIEQFV